MTANLHLLRETRAIEAIDPSLAEALAWAEEHVDFDRVNLNHVLLAFCAGRRHELEGVNDDLAALRERVECLGAALSELTSSASGEPARASLATMLDRIS